MLGQMTMFITKEEFGVILGDLGVFVKAMHHHVEDYAHAQFVGYSDHFLQVLGSSVLGVHLARSNVGITSDEVRKRVNKVEAYFTIKGQTLGQPLEASLIVSRHNLQNNQFASPRRSLCRGRRPLGQHFAILVLRISKGGLHHDGLDVRLVKIVVVQAQGTRVVKDDRDSLTIAAEVGVVRKLPLRIHPSSKGCGNVLVLEGNDAWQTIGSGKKAHESIGNLGILASGFEVPVGVEWTRNLESALLGRTNRNSRHGKGKSSATTKARRDDVAAAISRHPCGSLDPRLACKKLVT